jgi:hypothetical protein
MQGDDVEQPTALPHESVDEAKARSSPAEDPLRYAPSAAPGPTGYGPYFASLGRSLLFFTNASNLATFVVVYLILLVRDFVSSYGMCLAPVVNLIITGWYLAFQLNIVTNAAADDDEIPAITLTGGWLDDIIKPLFRMLAAYAIAAAPAIICAISLGLVTAGATGGPGAGPGIPLPNVSVEELVLLVVCIAAGFFVWPLLVLIIALGSVSGLLRIDLIAKTIVRSFPAYLIVVGIVYLSLFLPAVTLILVDVAGRDVPRFAISAGMGVVELYTTIVAMRAIGLYYHHFKQRFAWSWG